MSIWQVQKLVLFFCPTNSFYVQNYFSHSKLLYIPRNGVACMKKPMEMPNVQFRAGDDR